MSHQALVVNLPRKCSLRRKRILLGLFVAQSSVYYCALGWSPMRTIQKQIMKPSPERRHQRSRPKKFRRVFEKVLPFPASRDDLTEMERSLLESENSVLRDTIRQLEEENARLKQRANKIVLETFEGEKWFKDGEVEVPLVDSGGITLTGEEISQDELWCDELDGDQCPIEPTISFGAALRDRAYWLVGLLVMQSFSGIILSRNEALLVDHPVIIYFLTMLVGAGGNAGNQASVRVIRGLALGTLNKQTRRQFLLREFKMAAALSLILSIAGFCRAIFFKTAFPEAIAVTAALAMIVFSSICLGAILPLVLDRLKVDPAHSSTTIQVIMDILGVILAVSVSRTILDGPLGQFLLAKLGL